MVLAAVAEADHEEVAGGATKCRIFSNRLDPIHTRFGPTITSMRPSLRIIRAR